MKLIINGLEISAEQGKTILQIATENNIEIPTLCHDERTEIFASCGICMVEIENNPRLIRACSTLAADGMVIKTDTERIRRNRKTVLELLLSDHTGDCKAPCTLHCPAETDCQGYVKLIANGDYDGALKLIMEKIPIPASIGRVCPHPCEEACRRELVEEPIAICSLKQFVADVGGAVLCAPRVNAEYFPRVNAENFPHVNAEYFGTQRTVSPTEKRVGIIGGGPGGLSAAYFLCQKGHEVTIYEAQPKMGGMLRYGIPEYRLPKEILQKEINNIESMGVIFKNNTKVSLDDIKNKYDAIIIAIGAWTSTNMRCKGEDLENVLGGINFLREPPEIKGKTVAVVGGGNTAMDACRTAIRLGADKVYNIYRRTRNEMPAEEIEITEAEEEGVIFKFLTNPLEITNNSIRLQIMQLGEPDSSGRRSPVAVEGEEEVLEIDIVISAIGQKPNLSGFETLETTKWGTIIADENTFKTNIKGVYAIGDTVNDGAGIAVSAIGHAKKAAESIHAYIVGVGGAVPCTPLSKYIAKTKKTAEDFKDEPKIPRVKMPHRTPSERRNDFKEINLGLTEEAAKKEAARCLECGCLDYKKCKLIKYANNYTVTPDKYNGLSNRHKTANKIPNVVQTPEKCILCGLCVRICEDGVLGFVGRGFNTRVQPAGDLTPCGNCTKCAEICPTGALTNS